MALSYGFALQPTDDAAAFSNALRAITGDGVAQYGGRFSLTVNGFSVTAASGYAFAAGRWIENDEPLVMPVLPSWNSGDRTDAVAARVDYEGRVVGLEIMTDIDIEKIRADPTIIRNDSEYCVILYLIKVRRGATSLQPSDVTDVRGDSALCGNVLPLSAIAGDVLRVYSFLMSGIDEEIARLIEKTDDVCRKADKDIAALDEVILKSGGAADIGELMTCRHYPDEGGWILCDGGAVPDSYPVLSELLGGALPALSTAEDRYRTYIYGGAPVNV